LITRLLRPAVRRLGTGRIIIGLALLQFPVRVLLGALERRIPVDRRIVLFGSPQDRFADNAAYAFLAASGRPVAQEVYWITGSRATARRMRTFDLRVAQRWSPQGIWLTIRAGTFVVTGYRSDINPLLGSRATLVNLWHGIPFKRIERDITTGPLAVLHRSRPSRSLIHRALQSVHRAPDHLLSPSRYVSEACLTTAFGVDRDRCWEVGYPRNDHLAVSPAALPSGALVSNVQRWEELARSKVVGYFPTWRDNGGSALDIAGVTLAGLADAVARAGAVLLYKPHFNDPSPRVTTPNVRLIEPDEDLHAYLGLCDLLITDYSSVGLDFTLTGRPIIYFTPDFDEYRRTRGFYFSPDTAMVGERCATAEDLFAALARWSSNPAPAPDARYVAVSTRFWGDDAVAASHKVADLVLADSRPKPQAVLPRIAGHQGAHNCRLHLADSQPKR
jgi:CDP-glycerol glycerophosphotransferase (TagB/SpsB family)